MRTRLLSARKTSCAVTAQGETAVDALRGVSLDVSRASSSAVMGPSGSGKSTLMHILAALDEPTSGTVIDRRRGRRLASNDNELTLLRRKHIGFVFQFFNLLPMLTAEENVKLPLSVAGDEADKAGSWSDLRSGRALRPAQPPARRSSRAASSSASRSRAALVSQPTVVFADEPTGNLDSASSDEILACSAPRRWSTARRP